VSELPLVFQVSFGLPFSLPNVPNSSHGSVTEVFGRAPKSLLEGRLAIYP
jgi:hypothetical protein